MDVKISRAINFVFVDSFALIINSTLGTVLQTKICNYSWEGNSADVEQEKKDS